MRSQAGHEVSVLDEDPLSHERLDANQQTSWEDAGGRFTVGTALEMDALLEAGSRRPTCSSPRPTATTRTSSIAQIAQRRFGVERVIVRVLDPARAAWYAEQGLETICPTQYAIEQFRARRRSSGRR